MRNIKTKNSALFATIVILLILRPSITIIFIEMNIFRFTAKTIEDIIDRLDLYM